MSFEKRVSFDPKKEYYGDSPNVFVGEYGYPKLNVGLLSTEFYSHNDEPLHWSRHNYEIGRIVDLRSVMVNSSFKVNIKDFKNKFLTVGKEITMASKPVDIEIGLEKKPKFHLAINQDLMPQGPRVNLEKARITENVKVPRVVEKAVGEDDWKAVSAMQAMYKKNIDVHHMTKLLSIGNLGVKMERKLVPTKWSITAVDSTLSKKLRDEVKDFQEYDYVTHFGGHYGNYYLILFFPEVWSYELFETYAGSASTVRNKRTNTGTDYEGYKGRKKYAEETAGGYYATRLSLLEYLKRKKRQASCLVLRFITDEYYIPLGVWVVREAVKKALASKPIKFDSRDLMMGYARKKIKKDFWNYDLNQLLKRSRLLKNINEQSKLNRFM